VTEDRELLDRAVAELRDEPQRALPASLIARTQSRVREAAAPAAVTERQRTRALFLHPMFLLAAAAVATLFIGGVVAMISLSNRKPSTPIAKNDVPSEISPIVESTNPTKDADKPAPPPANGAIDGLVKFVGVAPKPQPLSMAANASCAAHHKGQVVDESILVNADGSLRNVVVWVSEGLEGRSFPAPKEPAVLDQQGCVYTPHVVTVMTGQKLLVKNSDPFLHNVHAAASDSNPPFNFGQPTVDGGRPLTFLSPDRMYVKCDVHPWMSAFILVFDNPFFAVTGSNGSFKLPELPPGQYTVSAWHEVYGEQQQRVTVSAGKPMEIQFNFQATQHASAADVHDAKAPCCKPAPSGVSHSPSVVTSAPAPRQSPPPPLRG
jgi:plastocyanin